MADMNAHHGVLGSDELIVAVSQRLREALPAQRRVRPRRQRRICHNAHGRRRRRCRGGDPRCARGSRAPALDRHRGACQRACRICAGAAPCHHARRTHAPRRTRAARGGQERAGRHRRLRARDRHRVERPEIHPARIAARDQRRTNWNCTISRSLPPMAGASSASRRCCAGPMPTRGHIPPAIFIPVAEQMGLMDTLGAFVLRRALARGQALARDLYIAVNLSPLQVRDRGDRRTGARGACRKRRHAVAAGA